MADPTNVTNWAEHLSTLDLALRLNAASSSLATAAHKGDADLVTIRLVEVVRAARAIGVQYDIRLIEDFDALVDALTRTGELAPIGWAPT